MKPMERKAIETITKAELFSAPPQIGRAFWDKALAFAVKKIKANISGFSNSYPAPASVNNVYPAIANTDWTNSFWTGMLYLAFEATGDTIFRKTADAQISDYRSRLDLRISTDTHDLGFLYSLSCVAATKLAENTLAHDTALKAADLLMLRYFEKAGIIQAWGDLSDPVQRGRIIIDCAMNLPLLYWASEETGNPYYREAAKKHIGQANEFIIRNDWSTFHTFYFDLTSGKPVKGVTHQGYSDESCWSRGQAWGIYGNALSYRYLRQPELLEEGRGLAHYFLNRLPEDLVSYWDLIFTEGTEEKDSSAAAIAVCGLLELSRHMTILDPDRPIFENAALRILESLAKHYTSEGEPLSNGILLHAVYGKPMGNGVDECNIWGDYFYMEALTRVTRDWKPYW